MRQYLSRISLAFILVTVVALPAKAQLCSGVASFANGSVRVGAAASFADGAKSFGGEVAAGGKQGAFVGASVGTVSYDDIDESGTSLGVNGGFGIALSSNKKAEICPVVGFEHQMGPNVETSFGTTKIAGNTYGFGASLGGVASSSPGFDFIPFASAIYVVSKATAKLAGVSTSSSEDYLSLTIGAGFVVNKVLTIQPRVILPVGLEDAKPTYGIGFAVNLGSKIK